MRGSFFLLLFFCNTLVLGQGTADSAVVARQVDSLLQVSRSLARQRDFSQALQMNAAAETAALDRFGRQSEWYGTCCFTRAMVNNRRGDFAEAEKWYLEANAIREKVLGKNHPDYAFSLSDLATLYSMKGEYEKAEPLFLEAKNIFEVGLNNRTHQYYLICLNNLGTMYSKTGDREKAEQLYLEMKEVYEVGLNNRTHPSYLSCLNNLAHLYSNWGEYEKAESLFLKTLAAREKTVGREHSAYVETLAGLGVLYTRLGSYAKAESLFLEVKSTTGKVLGNQHPQYAGSLTPLATLYKITGKYEQSEQLFLEALAILKKTPGEERTGDITLGNLANLYTLTGKYQKAEALLLDLLADYEKIPGKDSPDYAVGLGSLAYLYGVMGDYPNAERLYLEAKDIYEIRLHDRRHPFYRNCQFNLATLYKNTGRFEKAGLLFDELAGTNRLEASGGVHHLSEREMGNYLVQFSEIQDQTLSFTHLTGGKRSVTTCYDNALFYKGFLLNATGRIRRLALANPVSAEMFGRLKTCETRLAAQYALPPAERRAVMELETEADRLEKELARTVAGYEEATRQVGWQDVQRALKPGEAAVEFVHYRFWEKEPTDSVLYAALVVLSVGQPVFVPLFEERSLDSLLSAKKTRKSDYVEHLYGQPGKPGTKTAQSLYEIVWRPLEPILAGIRTVYVSPDGLLHRLNPGAIPLPAPAANSETLADRFRIFILGSTRFLAANGGVSPAYLRRSTAALLIGGVRYEPDSSALAATRDTQNPQIASRADPAFAQTDSTVRGGDWDFLPWTEKEVDAVAALLKAAGLRPEVRNGFAATEAFFKSECLPAAGSPRILHIATHGYFFPDPGDRKGYKADGTRYTAEEEPVFKISDHPMIRSGLLLAGANHAWKTGKPFRPGMEDGVLTAFEISQTDLSNTELVVLSACETGLGDIRGNEGVYGLQRAFKIAGAKYLVMSLWQVPDFQTQELMTAFYRKWLTEKTSIPDAFQAAQQMMRKKYEHPYFWAGFVLVE